MWLQHGLEWQRRAIEDLRAWIGVACFLGFLAFAITTMAFGVVFPRIQGEMNRPEAFAMLHAQTIHQIDVFDLYGDEKIVSITDREALCERRRQ